MHPTAARSFLFLTSQLSVCNRRCPTILSSLSRCPTHNHFGALTPSSRRLEGTVLIVDWINTSERMKSTMNDPPITIREILFSSDEHLEVVS